MKELAEEGEDIAVVDIEDASYPLYGFGIILTLSPYLVHMSYRKLCQFVQPDGVLFHREDIDVYTLLLPHPVVVVPFVQQRTTVAHLGIEEEIVRICLVGLQGKPVG